MLKIPQLLKKMLYLKKPVYDYIERFVFHIYIPEWKLDFDEIIVCVKSERKYNILSFRDLRSFLKTKIDYFEKQGNKFSHICERKITFISDLANMTYEHYHKQPKQMIEWVLIKKIHINPELINISHPLIRKYKCMFPQEGNQDFI